MVMVMSICDRQFVMRLEGLVTNRYTAADYESEPQPASHMAHSSTSEFLRGHEQVTWVLGLAHSIPGTASP
ncbi:hypothetical protein E2C01_002848 [Portunus trituberculatus]|uniref:Uncharacterized protein n=1 Tax=Portunus trituberculatus TaxID=210409 RepID=A0A5B7CPA2_PORTR|nr:hypothetical protein [Portunus trituberculatus]